MFKRVIKGTKVIAVIKRIQSRDQDQTWKTDTYTKKNTKQLKSHTQSNKRKQATRTPPLLQKLDRVHWKGKRPLFF